MSVERPPLPPLTARRAIQWLMYQHGMNDDGAKDVLWGISSSGSRMGKLRQEAIDVASFIEDIIEADGEDREPCQ